MNRNTAIIMCVVILAGIVAWLYFSQSSAPTLPAEQNNANIGQEAPANAGPARATTAPPGANF